MPDPVTHETESSSTLVKRKVDGLEPTPDTRQDKRRKGTAPVKEEFLVKSEDLVETTPIQNEANDDAAEAFHHKDRQPASHNSKGKRREKKTGQNKAREFGSSKDEVGLCSSRVLSPEFSPDPCTFGDRCRFEHDVRKYLREHKREDLATFGGICPVWETKGKCPAGWKCRFVGSHSKEIEHEDGRSELVLVVDAERVARHALESSESDEAGVANVMTPQQRIQLTKRKVPTPRSDEFLSWLDKQAQNPAHQGRRPRGDHKPVRIITPESQEKVRFITRADVASFMLAQLTSDQYLRQAVGIAN